LEFLLLSLIINIIIFAVDYYVVDDSDFFCSHLWLWRRILLSTNNS